MSSTSGCFLVSRNDGLVARLLPILAALRMGAELGVHVKIHWPVLVDTNHNTAEFESLFSQTFINDHFIDADEYKVLLDQAIQIETVRKMTKEELTESVSNGQVYGFANTMNKTQLISEDEEIVDAQYSRAISLISFTETVQKYLQDIDTFFADKRTLAYHIRHGDLTRHYRTRGKPWTAKYVPNEIYLEHIRGAATDASVSAILFGDCPHVLDWLKAKHPAIQRIRDLIPLDDLTSLQRNFLELYAMSRTSRLVAPKMSGFSQMAAGIGAAPVVDIMEDLSEDQIADAFAGLADRLENHRDDFSNDGDAAQCLAHLVPYLSSKEQDKTAVGILKREIEGGNTVPFLYQLHAGIAYRARDKKLLAEISNSSRDAMLFERSTVAKTDAMLARLEIEDGNAEAAIPPLRRAMYLAPFGVNVRDAVSELCTVRDLNLT